MPVNSIAQRGLVLIMSILIVLSISAFKVQSINACYFGYDYKCCSEPDCHGTCHSTTYGDASTDKEACSYDCSNNTADFCCEYCANECESNDDCGSGCTCIDDSNGNYCDCSGGGGGGGGGNDNEPPSCSITVPLNSPNNIFYDAKEYLNQTTGQLETQQPTTRYGKVNTDDPDNDDVTVESLTADRNCVQLTLNGENFTLIPQGHLTGVSPVQITGPRTCDLTLTATVTDGEDNSTCQKQLTIYYYPTYLKRMYLYDGNNHPEWHNGEQDANPVYDSGDFAYIGSNARDIATYTINVNNPNSPTRTLKPYNQRFTINQYLKSDHTPLLLTLTLDDVNGTINQNLGSTVLYFKGIAGPSTGFKIPLRIIASSEVITGQEYNINTYGVDLNGNIVEYNNPSSHNWGQCMQDTHSVVCVRGYIHYYKWGNYPRHTYAGFEIYPKSSAISGVSTPQGVYKLEFGNAYDLEGIAWFKWNTTTALANNELGFTDPNKA